VGGGAGDVTYTVTVFGARQLRATLARAGVDLADLKNANAAAAATVASAATAGAPRRTGALASTVRGNRAVGKAVVLAGRASVVYAGPIHWGWPGHHIAAQPFLSDAATSTEPVWLAAYQHDVQAALDKVHGI
jgi:hypothetical protein